jgi:ferredoxin
MCQFCTKHGDGEVWYLEAASYSADLDSDLVRRDYLKRFIGEFDHSRAMGIVAGDTLGKMPHMLKRLGAGAISRKMQTDHFGQPVPLEDIEKILDMTTSVVQLPCLCRTQAGKAPEGVCLAVTTRPYDELLAEAYGANPAFRDGPDVSRFERLTKEETLSLLRACETRGLMHSVWTFKSPFIGAICNCDRPSGCMAMRLTLDYGIKLMWKGENLIEFAEDECTGCGACAGACPFGALSYDRTRHRAVVDAVKCYGCGTCRAACAADALTLTDRRPMIGTVLPARAAW